MQTTIFRYNKKDIKITGSESDLIFKRIKNSGYYEIDLLEEIKRMNIRGIYVDIGANLGNHCIFFAMECNATHIYAFEPYSVSYSLLCANIEQNKLEQHITTNNNAISSIVSKADTVENSGMANLGNVSIIIKEDGEISTTTIDVYFKNIPNIALIKVDIEGHEYHALLGASVILQRDKPVLIIEMKTEEVKQKIMKYLSQFGYAIVGKYCASPTYVITTPIEEI